MARPFGMEMHICVMTCCIQFCLGHGEFFLLLTIRAVRACLYVPSIGLGLLFHFSFSRISYSFPRCAGQIPRLIVEYFARCKLSTARGVCVCVCVCVLVQFRVSAGKMRFFGCIYFDTLPAAAPPSPLLHILTFGHTGNCVQQGLCLC